MKGGELHTPIGLWRVALSLARGAVRAPAPRLVCAVVAVLGLAVLGALPAQTQATRTWVSGMGDDADPCSRTAPCRTFAGAINKTAAGGEINALDPGPYGAVTIGKSLTIDGTGTFAGILAASQNGVVVNATTPVVVRLRGLQINGVSGTSAPGFNGIRVLSPATVYVEDAVIDGFSTHGIDFRPTGPSELYVTNTTIRNVGGSGIFGSATNGLGTVMVDNSRIENNAIGVNARNNLFVTVNDSVVVGNATAGLQAQADVGGVDMDVESTLVSFNGTGLQAGGGAAPSTMRISDLTIVGNTLGINIGAQGTVASFQNNRNDGNGTDGAPNAAPGPGPVWTPVLTPTATPTPTITPTPTRTPTPTPFPQPNVALTVQPSGTAGRLQVTIRARDANCSPNNRLVSLQFTRLTNATIEVPGGSVSPVTTAPTTVTLAGGPAQVTLTVVRTTAGQASTAELIVTDGCGTWPTFVGGGPNAF